MSSYLFAVSVVAPAITAVVWFLISLTQRNTATPPLIEADAEAADAVNDVGFLRVVHRSGLAVSTAKVVT